MSVQQQSKQPTRQAVQQDLPHVLAFLEAIEPSLGESQLSEVIQTLKLATVNDAALSLVVDAVGGQRQQTRPGRVG